MSGDALEGLLGTAVDGGRQHKTADGTGVGDPVDRASEAAGELVRAPGAQEAVVVEEQHPASIDTGQGAVSSRGEPPPGMVLVGDPGGSAHGGQPRLVGPVLQDDDVERTG
jgi:hypothetical protein